jgi:CubicO group peptidase (beta-lactamase class C family)
VIPKVGIDWAGLAVERVTGLTLNQYLTSYVFQPLGVENLSMIPNAKMREKLAHMHFRDSDGILRPRDHLLRAPLVVDLESEAEMERIFNSGGAGMFAKPQEYCSKQ